MDDLVPDEFNEILDKMQEAYYSMRPYKSDSSDFERLLKEIEEVAGVGELANVRNQLDHLVDDFYACCRKVEEYLSNHRISAFLHIKPILFQGEPVYSIELQFSGYQRKAQDKRNQMRLLATLEQVSKSGQNTFSYRERLTEEPSNQLAIVTLSQEYDGTKYSCRFGFNRKPFAQILAIPENNDISYLNLPEARDLVKCFGSQESTQKGGLVGNLEDRANLEVHYV